MSESPDKGRERSALDDLIMKLLKKWMSRRNARYCYRMDCAYGLINEQHDRLKASVLLNGGRFEH